MATLMIICACMFFAVLAIAIVITCKKAAECRVDVGKKDVMWRDFLESATVNNPVFNGDMHVWRTFKKFVSENSKKYMIKEDTVFKGFSKTKQTNK